MNLWWCGTVDCESVSEKIYSHAESKLYSNLVRFGKVVIRNKLLCVCLLITSVY